MAHHIYTTDAFILGSSAGREADKFCVMFTEELGLIRASARGVRLQKSKLRYSLQDFSLSTVSVVKGKEFWRITSARQKDDLYGRYRADRRAVYSIARIFRMIDRLIPEEEKNEDLFKALTEAFVFLAYAAETEPLDQAEILSFEYIVALRILHHLGYLENLPELRDFVAKPWSVGLVRDLASHRKLAIETINASIRNSHL